MLIIYDARFLFNLQKIHIQKIVFIQRNVLKKLTFGKDGENTDL